MGSFEAFTVVKRLLLTHGWSKGMKAKCSLLGKQAARRGTSKSCTVWSGQAHLDSIVKQFGWQ